MLRENPETIETEGEQSCNGKKMKSDFEIQKESDIIGRRRCTRLPVYTHRELAHVGVIHLYLILNSYLCQLVTKCIYNIIYIIRNIWPI